MKSEKYNSSFSYNWHYELFSWSAALVVVGMALLVASSLSRGEPGRRSMTVAEGGGTAPPNQPLPQTGGA